MNASKVILHLSTYMDTHVHTCLWTTESVSDPGTCVPAPGTRTGAGITTVIVCGTVLTVPDGVGVNAGLVQGVDNCKTEVDNE
jgi:hypothetical protein